MTTDTIRPTTSSAAALRRLYFIRFGFAVVWAGLLFTTGGDLGALAAVLLVLYPAFDVAAAVYDARSTRSPELYFNIAVSSLTAVGLAIAAASGKPAVLVVWGAWAILAGIVQLVVALRRRRLGGQWPMILSGGLSALVGLSFLSAARQDDPSLLNIAGYATVGGVFFLISAIRLGRAARTAGGN